MPVINRWRSTITRDSDANPPLADSGGATGAYTSDADGRLTSRPNQRLEWDAVGRLIRVRPATGTGITATYTYDGLDRLLTTDEGGLRTRYRYMGQTTAVAQTVNDATNVAIRSIGTDWGGERLVDWTTGGANQRFYGTNGHHDVTWTADSTGAVSATLRYDPWGTITSSTGSSTPDFRFQGSLYDSAIDLSWAVTRWYAPSLGRFVSEDSLLGDANDPPSRHLFAYAEGEPIARFDPDGGSWCSVLIAEGMLRVCSESSLYHGATRRHYAHAIENRAHAHGIFKIADFISTKWVDAPFTNGLKGDWRGPSQSWNIDCLESRVCMTIDLNHNVVTADIEPSCEKRTEWTYRCKDALDINGWLPLENSVRWEDHWDGTMELDWSLNQSITWGVVPIDGMFILVPPGLRNWRGDPTKPFVKLLADGYPSMEVWYRRVFTRRLYYSKEGSPIDLGPGLERQVKVAWPWW